MDGTPSFGAWLKRRRKALDLTQQELADQAGCSTALIRKIEADERRPSRQLAERLADVLEIRAADLQLFLRAARTEPSGDQLRMLVQAGRATARDVRRNPHNLPSALTPLIAREQDVALAAELLLGKRTRLLTMVGPGGIGKTRLALEVAAELVGSFADGVFFIGLAPIRNPELVPLAILRSLGLDEHHHHSPLDQLITSLWEKELLLVLDNFEQVLAAAPQLLELLSACAGVKLIVTSRTVLRLRAEQQFPVLPLSTPTLAAPISLGELAACPSVMLFLDRACAINPRFRLDETNAEAIRVICAYLEGIPLALELVTAQLKLMSPRELLERLDSRMAALPEGPIDLPPRHRTLADALSWSYDLLDEGERVLFEQMSVFNGGWTLEAAETIVHRLEGAPAEHGAPRHMSGSAETPHSQGRRQEDRGPARILRRLGALIDKSLVLQRAEPDGTVRFYMLETVREYGWTRLVQTGGADAVAHSHALYFLALAEEGEQRLAGPEQQPWLNRLAGEHDNLRASLEWALASGEQLIALRLAGALARFWFMRGYLRDGMAALEQVLRREAPASAPEAELKARAKALNGAGVLGWAQGEPGRARGFFEQSLPLFEALEDRQGVASTLNNLGNLARDEGNYQQAALFYERSLRLHRELGSRYHIAGTLHNLGVVAHSLNDYAQARGLLEESLALRTELGDRWGCAAVFDELGLVALHEGDFAAATRLCEQGLELFRELGDRRYSAYALGKLARAALALGRGTQARALWRESLGFFHELDQKDGIAECLEGLARVALLGHDPPLAALLYGSAASIRATIGVPLPHAELPAHERELEELRGALSQTRFELAWARGKAMALPEVVALALGERAGT